MDFNFFQCREDYSQHYFSNFVNSPVLFSRLEIIIDSESKNEVLVKLRRHVYVGWRKSGKLVFKN